MKRHIVMLCALGCATPAFASHSVELKYVGTGLGANVKAVLDGNGQDVFAGEIKHEARNGIGSGAMYNGTTLLTFCTELDEHVSDQWQVFTITDAASTPAPGMGAMKAQAVADVFALLTEKRSTNTLTGEMAAAFQVAVWEIIHDFDAGIGRGSLDVAAGRFEARGTDGNPLGAAVSAAVSMFFDTVGSGAAVGAVTGFTNESRQDQIVPTPGAAALFAAAGVLGLRRRRS